jgi:hypothetical protein
MPETKRCTRCGRELPLSEFHFKYKASGQRQPRCRTCVSEYSRQRREQKGRALPYRGPGPVTVVTGSRGARFLKYPCEVCGKMIRVREKDVIWWEAHGIPRPRTCSKRCGGILRTLKASRSLAEVQA